MYVPRRKVVPGRFRLSDSDPVRRRAGSRLGAIGDVVCCIVRVPLYDYYYSTTYFFSSSSVMHFFSINTQIGKSPAVLFTKEKKICAAFLGFSPRTVLVRPCLYNCTCTYMYGPI